jgi:CheY-like chemotaxis protein
MSAQLLWPFPPADGESGSDRPKCVLVAEDEQSIRVFVKRALERGGYHVETTDNGAAAWARFVEMGGEVDLVLTDMRMPELTGHVLIERLAERPNPPTVIAMSGEPNELQRLRDRWGPNLALLPKPFDLTSLYAAFGRARDGRSAAPWARVS